MSDLSTFHRFVDLLFSIGEIDILEGVNDHGTDQATLHTTAGTFARFLQRYTHCNML